MTAEIIPFARPPTPKEQCSFCKTPKANTRVLISNHEGKYICDACVQHAAQRLTEVTNEV